MDRLVSRMMAPLARRVASMLARGVVTGVEADGTQQVLQVRLLAGEAASRVEHFEPYGFTSHPKAGAEHLTLFLDGDRAHGVTVVVNDRRFRLASLPEGGVALYDAAGSSIVLNNDGTATVHADTVTMTGNLLVQGFIKASGHIYDLGGVKSLAGLRTAFVNHTGHNYPGSGPNTTP